MGKVVGLVIDPPIEDIRLPEIKRGDPVSEADPEDVTAGPKVPSASAARDLPQPLGGSEASESYETLEGSVVPLEDVNEPAAVPGRSRPKGKG